MRECSRKFEVPMLRLFLIVVLLVTAGCTSTPEKTNAAVGAILSELQVAINTIAEDDSLDSLPPLDHAELVLATETVTTTGGEATLVISGKKERVSTEVSQLTLTLQPGGDISVLMAGNRNSGKKLAAHVVAAVRAVDAQDALALTKLVIETGLEIVDNGSGGFEIEISGISVAGGRSVQATSGNTMKLVFTKAQSS